MTYALNPGDPVKASGDTFVSEQIELVCSAGTTADHQILVNDFLITLRDTPDHLVIIRSVHTETLRLHPISSEHCTQVRYTLIGDLTLPYLPSP